VALKPPTPPSVTSLVCRGCGAPLEIRAPGRSIVVACGACGTVLDAQDPDGKIIARYETKNTVVPRIPLGSRGRLKGEAWEVVGYQVRRTIADVPFTWFEHLLYNPTAGFRWLVEYGGHWTLTKSAAGVPKRLFASVLLASLISDSGVFISWLTAETNSDWTAARLAAVRAA